MAKLLNCEFCKIDFYSKTRNYKQRFCSKSCAGKGNQNSGRIKKGQSPWNKGLKNWRIGYTHSEQTKKQIGESNRLLTPNPITPKKELIRKSAEYKNWRRQIFIRDDFKCQICGIKSIRGHRIVLNAHHIEEFSKNMNKILDINNGITLCIDCHRNIHRKDFTGQKAEKE